MTYQALKVTSGTDPIQVVIRNKSVRNSSKVLGVVMILVKNGWTDEINRLATKSDNHARLTMSHRHQRCDADLSHSAIWVTQHTYSLPITTSIPNKSLELIQMKSQQASLGKMGYNIHFPKAIVYGPISHGGLNMMDLSVLEQGIRGIANVIHYLYTQDSISKLIHISIRASQLES